MKALSFHQPRAEQIIRGEKTVDVRTWHVTYRGPLAVHAAAKRRNKRCRALGFDPDALAYGAVLGVVELHDIRPLDAETYAALRDQHRLEAPYPGEPCYGWFFQSPRRLPAPVPTRGRMRLFEVEENGEWGMGNGEWRMANSEGRRASGASRITHHVSRFTSSSYRVTPPPAPDPARPFALYTLAEEDAGGYRVALYQWVNVGQASQPVNSDQAKKPDLQEQQAPGALWHIEVGGDPLRAVTDHLLAALRANGYKATDLARAVGSETPFYLDEPTGLRLALILMAVKPLSRHDRIEAIGQGVQAMSAEEAYYWFSKCSADAARGTDATRAQKALRVLLADT